MTEIQIAAILGASVVPSLLWLAYFMQAGGDRRLSHGVLFFLAGMVAAPVAWLLFSAIELAPFYAQLSEADTVSKAKRFAYTIFAIGPIEEMSKFIVFWTVIRLLPVKAEQIRSTLLWSAAVGLGFASVENWYYMFKVEEIAWARALTLPFNHVLFCSFWGVGFARASQGRRIWLITTLLLAIVYHGLYDYILLSDSISPLFILPIVLLLYIWLSVNLRRDKMALAESERQGD